MTSSTVVQRGVFGLVLAIFAESLLTPAGIHFVSPSLPLINEEFQQHPWADTLVPMIITLPGLMIALCAPLMGGLADRIGVRPLLIGSTLVYLTVGIMPYWLGSLTAIVAGRLVFGVAESALSVCGPVLIAVAFTAGGRRAMIGGRLALIGIASVALALAGGWAAGYGWRFAFLLYSLATIPLILILLFVPKLDTMTVMTAVKERSRSLLPVFGLSMVYGTGIPAIYVFMPFLLRDLGYDSPSTASSISAISSFTTALASMAYPFVERVVARRHLISGTFVLMGVGCFILGNAPDVFIVGVGAVTISFGMGLFAAAIMDFVLEASPTASRGKATGMLMTSIYLGGFLAPFAINGLRGMGFALSQAYLGLTVFFVIIAGIGFAMRRSLAKSAQEDLPGTITPLPGGA